MNQTSKQLIDREDIVTLIRDKTKGIHTVMLGTHSSAGKLNNRPMGIQDISDSGVVTFMTDRDSNKIHEINNSAEVNVAYTASNGVTFVSLGGVATLSDNPKEIEELWTSFHEAWFEGPHDPRITLIKVAVKRFEYWDYDGGKIGAYVDMATSAITGNKADSGTHAVYEL